VGGLGFLSGAPSSRTRPAGWLKAPHIPLRGIHSLNPIPHKSLKTPAFFSGDG